MLRIASLFTILLFLFPSTYAKKSTTFKPKISLKSNLLTYRFYFTDKDYIYPEFYEKYIMESRFEFPSLALSIERKKGNRHEIEIFNFHYQKNKVVTLHYPQGNQHFELKFQTYSLEAGYSYLFLFFKKKPSDFRLFLGTGSSFLYEKANMKPPPHTFPIDFNSISIYANIDLGVQYHPIKKVYLQFAIPLSWRIYGHAFQFIDNPSLTDDQQHTNFSNRQIAFYIPERIGLRLGLGYIF